MNIVELHTTDNKISAVKIDSQGEAAITAIKILKDETLAEHITKVPAVLVCITGETIYETEKGVKESHKMGSYVNIPENVTHWLKATKESHLLLIK